MKYCEKLPSVAISLSVTLLRFFLHHCTLTPKPIRNTVITHSVSLNYFSPFLGNYSWTCLLPKYSEYKHFPRIRNEKSDELESSPKFLPTTMKPRSKSLQIADYLPQAALSSLS